MASLKEYNKKRRFDETPEPEGTPHTGGSALRFVVQKHDASHLHYDFRLELDGVLKSWAVPKGPSMNPKDKRLAMMTEDHPLSYATFEGVIPEGNYGAGEVIVWDEGVYQSDETANLEAGRKKLKHGLKMGELSLVLLGEKLKGGFTLVKMSGRGENAWLLVKKKDEYVTADDVTAETSSVRSDARLTRDAGAKKPPRPKKRPGKADAMPHKIRPMLATLTETPFDRPGWFFEVKWDGYRAIAEVAKDIRLYSRNGHSFRERYAPIADALSAFKHECVLDGEIVAFKEGKPDFHTLQQYDDLHPPLSYVLFDLLYLDGRDLRSEPLRIRKKLLAEIMPQHPLLALSEHIEDAGTAFFAHVEKEGLEGMVAKDAASTYADGRRSDRWLKVKSFKEQEAVIVGYTKPRGSRKLIGALVLAVYDNGELRYIGHSGGGFTQTELESLHEKLSQIRMKRPPLEEKVPINSPITWVEPHYVCQVRFSEWTAEGRMRHPIYNGLRTDKPPREVVREMPMEQNKPPQKKKEPLHFTNRDKIFFPEEGYTKGDLIDYYDRMADILLPYLKDRPQNLNRHPGGIGKKNFYQKNFTAKLPSFVETKEIWSESNNAYLRYIVCNNKETLLYLANLGCIEINPWSSRIDNLNRPDYMILDLDPHERSFEELIVVAREVKRVLDETCAEHYPKTSGKTGIHVVVPLGGRYDYDAIKTFAELLMRIVHARLPDLTSLERSPRRREGKIYLDYLQNRFGQTLACAYSVRPYKGATVSTPLSWSEVRKGLNPAKFTIKTIETRLKKKGDLWKPVLGKGTDLQDAIRCLQEAEQ